MSQLMVEGFLLLVEERHLSWLSEREVVLLLRMGWLVLLR